jgi:hypothetical protein
MRQKRRTVIGTDQSWFCSCVCVFTFALIINPNNNIISSIDL